MIIESTDCPIETRTPLREARDVNKILTTWQKSEKNLFSSILTSKR